MKAFTHLTGDVLVLDQQNIDTDQIIPARFLTTTSFAGSWMNTCSQTGARTKTIY